MFLEFICDIGDCQVYTKVKDGQVWVSWLCSNQVWKQVFVKHVRWGNLVIKVTKHFILTSFATAIVSNTWCNVYLNQTNCTNHSCSSYLSRPIMSIIQLWRSAQPIMSIIVRRYTCFEAIKAIICVARTCLSQSFQTLLEGTLALRQLRQSFVLLALALANHFNHQPCFKLYFKFLYNAQRPTFY